VSIDQTMGRMPIGFQSVDRVRETVTRRIIDKNTRRVGAPDYDSVVVAGNGIGALSFAARMARSDEFAGKVTIVAPPIEETRKLINGVSLRGRAADYISSAIGCTHTQLVQAITDYGSGKPACYRQTSSMAAQGRDGSWNFSRIGAWQGGHGGSDRPIVYGARNSRVTGGMWDLMADLGIRHIEEKAESAERMRAMANGTRPLLVNATTNPRLLGAEATTPVRMVLAVQVPFMVKPGGIAYPLQSSSAYAPLIRRNGIIDVGYFTPFADPLSPRSTWYGIFARVVDVGSGFDKDEELAIMTDELFGVGDALGLEPDDPDETLARALVPAAGFWGAPASAPGTLELKRAYSGGAPCFYADGMISAALGGLLAAEAVMKGDDADRVVRRALRPLRWHNYIWWVETTRIAVVADALMRLNVNLAMAYPHTAGMRLWAASA